MSGRRVFFKARRFVSADTPSGVAMEHREFNEFVAARDWCANATHGGQFDVVALGALKCLRCVQVEAAQTAAQVDNTAEGDLVDHTWPDRHAAMEQFFARHPQIIQKPALS